MAESGTIDSLQIEIEASSKSAVQQINNLAKAFKNLKAATGGGLNIGNFKKELGKLGNNEYTKIEKLAQALQGLKNVKLDDKIGNSMLKIADACELIEQQHIDKLTKFGTALQTIKSISTKGYDQLPAAILNIAAAVDSITDDSIARLSRLTTALSNLRGVDLRGLGAVLRAQNEANRANRQRGSNGATSSTDSGQSNAGGDTGEDEVTRRIKQATKPTTAISNATKSMLQTLAKDLKNVASAALNAAKALGGKFLSAIKSVASAAIGFGKNILVTQFQTLASRVKKLTDRMHNLISSFKRVLFYRAVRTVIKELGDAMKEGEENAYWYTKTIGDATHYIAEAYDTFASASAMMKNQVGAAWATLFANLEPIITKIVEMVSRAAEVVTMFFAKLGGKSTYLKAINYGKEWAETTEKGSEAAKEWRNQLMGFDEINRLDAPDDSNKDKDKNKTPDYGAMFEEVPVESGIGDLADKIKDLWNAQDWKALGDLIGKTLNDLFPSKEKWAEWGSKLGSWINGAIQTAYYALKAIDFHDWGDRVAAGINAALEQIDFGIWGRLLVRQFTAALDFLLGLLGGLNWKLVGKSIGDFLRGALDEATEWLASYNWGDMAKKLWSNVLALIDGFNVPEFAKSLSNFIITAAESAADFLDGIDWSDVVDTLIGTLSTFFDNFQLDKVIASIGRLLNSIKTALVDAFTAFGEWLRSKDWKEVGSNFNESLQKLLNGMLEIIQAIPWHDIGKAIGDFLGQIDWIDVLKKLASGLWEAFSGVLSGLFDSKGGKVILGIIAGFEAIKVLFAGAKAFAIFEAAKLFVGGIAGAGGLGALVPALGSIVTGMGAALAPIASVIFSPTGLIVAAVIAAGILIIKNWDEIKEAAGRLKEKLEKDWESIKESTNRTWNNIKETVSQKWNGLKTSASTIWEAIKSTISTKFEDMKSKAEQSVSKLYESVKSNWESIKSVTSEKWSNISSKIASVVDTVNQKVSAAWETVKQKTTSSWNSVKEAITQKTSEIKSSASEKLSSVASTVKEKWDGIKEKTSSTWENIKSVVSDKWNAITSTSQNAASNLQNSMSGAFNDVQSTISNATGQVSNSLNNGWSNAANAVVNTMRNMANQIMQIFQQLVQQVSAATMQIHNMAAQARNDAASVNVHTATNTYQPNVSWHAKGGIIDSTTLFGLGEAGAEAIIPLERNTEWIGKVAAEMNRQSANSGGRDESNDDVIDALYTICDRIIRAIPDGGDDVDMDSFARTLTKIQRRQARAMG